MGNAVQAERKGKLPVYAGIAGIVVLAFWLGRASRAVPEPASLGISSPSAVAATSAPALTPVAGELAPQVFDLQPDPHFSAGIELRPMDRDIFGALMNPSKLDRKQLPDLFPDRPYRVRLIGSVAERRFGHVMIDLTRDGSIDERWELRGGDVSRVVQQDPAAGGPVRYTLAHGRWQAH